MCELCACAYVFCVCIVHCVCNVCGAWVSVACACVLCLFACFVWVCVANGTAATPLPCTAGPDGARPALRAAGCWHGQHRHPPHHPRRQHGERNVPPQGMHHGDDPPARRLPELSKGQQSVLAVCTRGGGRQTFQSFPSWSGGLLCRPQTLLWKKVNNCGSSHQRPWVNLLVTKYVA